MRSIFLLGVLTAAMLPFGLQNTTGRRFSAATLKGTCIWQEVKYPTTSGEEQGLGPATILASVHFDGSGGMTMDYDANVNGTYSSTNGASGSYSIDSTGHGRFTFTSPATSIVRTYDFRISSNGRALYTIAEADGGLSVTQRVSAGSCRFQE